MRLGGLGARSSRGILQTPGTETLAAPALAAGAAGAVAPRLVTGGGRGGALGRAVGQAGGGGGLGLATGGGSGRGLAAGRGSTLGSTAGRCSTVAQAAGALSAGAGGGAARPAPAGGTQGPPLGRGAVFLDSMSFLTSASISDSRSAGSGRPVAGEGLGLPLASGVPQALHALSQSPLFQPHL